MKHLFLFYFLILPLISSSQTQLTFEEPVKQRVFVLTDITNEPDDQQSLVRFLVYANEYDVEGIVATTSTHLRSSTRQEKIEELVRNYGKVKSNLDKHAAGFPSMEDLLAVTASHLPLYSMQGVGEGKDSKGSELLIKAVDKTDDRPLWVSVWGGANCLAQALWKVGNTRSSEEVKHFVSKLRIYAISDQDFAGTWVRNNFPGIFYIVDPSAGDSYIEYYKATWTGISGDKFYKHELGDHFELVDNPWLKENIMENHGPLGANYPELDYIMEGDTPAFLGLIQNGLAWYKSPSYGGWAGRYDFFKAYAEVDKIWTSSINSFDAIELPNGKIIASNQATIWRWRKSFQHDFAARMDWNVADEFNKANHNPIIVLNGNKGKAFAHGKIQAGDNVSLSAKGTYDPDGNELKYKWWVYKGAGRCTGDLLLKNSNTEMVEFMMPQLKSGQEIHLILEVEDSGSPSLFSYRRIILSHPD